MLHTTTDQQWWSLPLWTVAPTAADWQALHVAIATPTAFLWLPRSVADSLGFAYPATWQWLHAPSRAEPSPLPFETAYPIANEALAIGRLAHDTQAASLVGAEGLLGHSLDATLDLFAGRWGSLLDACGCLAELEGQLLGAAVVTLGGPTPLLPLLAARNRIVAYELVLTVLDALHDYGYPGVDLLLRPDTPFISIAEMAGFAQREEMVYVQPLGT